MPPVIAYAYDSYPAFIREFIRQMPSGGRGELLRLARHIDIHTSTLSQILSGKKHLTLEQASAAGDYFGLSETESRYFLLLVLHERAGTPLLREKLKAQLFELKISGSKLTNILPQDRPLTEEEKAVFYSNWYYTAIWAQTDIPGFQSRESLQRRFQLPRKLVNEVVAFLVQTGLCIERKGALTPGHHYTHLDSGSPLISRHHANWRIQAMQKHTDADTEELFYSSPLTVSSADAAKIRKLITDLILEVNAVRGPSPSEELRCLNVDWFKI